MSFKTIEYCNHVKASQPVKSLAETPSLKVTTSQIVGIVNTVGENLVGECRGTEHIN